MIRREDYLEKIRPFYESDLVKVIIGIRRCGKSVLLKQIADELLEKGVDSGHLLYINFEDMDFSPLQTAMDLHRYVKQQIQDSQKYYLFFDEIQNVENFEKAINSFRASMNVSIFITGSNSRLLSGELATLLSGRYVSFQIYPFRLREACELKGITKEQLTDEIIFDYVIWGGMPQRFQFQTEAETKVFLTDLYNSIVLRDIVQRNKIKEVDVLNRLMEYMVTNTSQTFSAASVSKYFESVNRKISTETLYAYLNGIVSAMILEKAVRYDIRGKKILTRMDKYYLTDTGLGSIKNTGFKREAGAMLENVVYNELLTRGYEVYVGKTQNGEIDFVAVKDGKKEYYQVAYLLAAEEVIRREFGAFSGIADNYPKYVISMDKFDFSRDGIIHKNLADFLME